MKTAELSGALLDYWVAKAEGHPLSAEVWHADGVFIGHGTGDLKFFAPSTDWSQGGPIIQREEIDVGSPGRRVHRMGGPNAGWGRSGIWGACTWRNGANGRRSFGWHETDPLVAAMRCYVLHKFGEDVEDITP